MNSDTPHDPEDPDAPKPAPETDEPTGGGRARANAESGSVNSDPADGEGHRADESVKQDASTGNIILYALGNIENAFCNLFPSLLNTIMVVAFQVQPLLMGAMLFLKTVVDAITDPIMAHISDNAKTRFGRRKPFILFGATGRLLTIVLMFALFPASSLLLNNQRLADEDSAQAAKTAEAAETASISATGNTEGTIEANGEAPVAEVREAESVPAPEERPAPGNHDTEGGFGSLAYEKTLQPLVKGFKAFVDPANAEQRSLVLYVGIGLILFTLFSTVVSTPYYAFGIELCSSYEGRTKLVVYRSVIDKIFGILNPWITPLIFATFWYSVIQGYLAVACVFAFAGIVSTVVMVWRVPEPSVGIELGAKKPRIGFGRSLWITVKNPHFLRVFALYQVVGIAQGTFVQFAIFLNIYYVMASATAGSVLTAVAQTLGISLALIALPLTKLMADRLEKHRAVLIGLVLMAIGSVLSWWTFTPKNPWLQLINPFFFSIGISGFYAIMGALLADVTDVDELIHGRRREGMFAAVMSLMGKLVASAIPLLSAIMLTMSGFDPTLKFDQAPGTFDRMRALYAFAPLPLLAVGVWIAATYPLNRARMEEIKEELARRRESVVE